jgi:hypothetical protein
LAGFFLAGLGCAGSAAWAQGIDCHAVDADYNNVINASDLEAFLACLTGPAIGPPAAPCFHADLDGDGDVDQDDYGWLQPCIGRDIGPSSVFITEMMALNGRTIFDENGDYPDWFELYNSGFQDVNLAGWYVTDDPGRLTQWRFPATVIKRGEHLVVFASGKDRAVAGAKLHTNFRLDRGGGESLLLVKPDGATVASALGPAFPRQAGDVSYGPRAMSQNPILIGTDTPTKYLVPANGNLGLTWTGLVFDETGWSPGTTLIGYESPGTTGYENVFTTDVRSVMYTIRGTIYIRIPFTVTDPAAILKLTLRIKYDDGYVAYLNGKRVASRNAPTTPAWNSNATASHSDSLALAFEDVDITANIPDLLAGANILAVHGLNQTPSNSDFLIGVELRAELPAVYLLDDDPRYFTTPTPGGTNGTTGLLGLVSDTRFSIDRGFYTQPFEVAISTQTPGATIRYTTDGSTPTPTSGTIYTGPVPINTTTVLRALAYKADHLSTNVDTQTYLFPGHVPAQPANPAGFPATWGGTGSSNPLRSADYEMDPRIVNSATYAGRVTAGLTSIPTLSVATDVNNWFSPTTGIYSNSAREGELWERPASAELLYPDGREGFHLNAAVRIQGGSSTSNWKSPKLSMRLLFKPPYGPKRLEFPLYPDSPVSSFNTLVLDAHLNLTWTHTTDATQRLQAQYVRDAFVADLQRATGWPAPHSVFVHLYVNGLHWGLYDLHERPDESFCADYFGGDEDDYDVLKHEEGTVVEGDNFRYLLMMNVAEAGLADPFNYSEIQRYLDLDAFIDYMIVNFYAGNTDWAHQNWYAGGSRGADGRFRYISWDAEHVLKSPTENVTAKDNGYGSPTWLHQRLRYNPEYNLRFADHVHRHFFNGGVLYVDPANPAVDPARPERNRPGDLYMRRIAEIDTAIILESARWGDCAANPQRPGQPYERDVEWINELNRLRTTYFPFRSATVLQQLRSQGLYPNVAAPTFSQFGGAFADGFALTLSAAGKPVYYTLDGSDPRLAGGAVSGSALVYGQPVALSGPVRVRARALDGGTWSALTEALFSPQTPPALRVTEVMYHPPAGGAYDKEEYEFIEVQNRGAVPIELEGMTLSGGVTFTFPRMMLAPGGFAVVVENPAAFAARYGAAGPVAGRYAGQLKNSGDTVRLADALGQTILAFTYIDTWYPTTDGGGRSLTIVDPDAPPDAWNDPAGWRASSAQLGSPGVSDP